MTIIRVRRVLAVPMLVLTSVAALAGGAVAQTAATAALPLELRIQAGRREFRHIRYSPDGRVLVAVEEHRVSLWHAPTGRELRSFTNPRFSSMTAAALSPNGQELVTGGFVNVDVDRLARSEERSCAVVVSALTGERLYVIPTEREMWCSAAAFSPNGARLAVGSGGGTVLIWDAVTRAPVLRIKPHEDYISALQFLRDGHRLLTVSGSTVQTIDAATGSHIRTLRVGFKIEAAHLLADEDTVVLTGGEGLVQVWSLAKGTQTQDMGGFTGHVHVAPAPDGRSVIFADDTVPRPEYASKGGAVRWDVRSNTRTPIEGLADVWAIAYSPDGEHFVSGHENHLIVWSSSTLRPLIKAGGEAPAVLSSALSGNDQRLLTAHADGRVQMWDLSVGIPTQALQGHEGDVVDVALSRDDSMAVTAGRDSTLRVWDLASSDEIEKVELTGTPTAVRFGPGGRYLTAIAYTDVLFYNREDKQLRGFSVISPQQLDSNQPLGAGHPHYPLAVDIERSRVAAGWPILWIQIMDKPVDRPKNLKYIDFSRGNDVELPSGPNDSVYALSFSPDGASLLVAKALDVEILDLEAPSPSVRTTFPEESVFAADFAPDNRRVAIGTRHGRISIWDTRVTRELLQITGHAGPVTSLHFTRDGQGLLSTGEDGTARFWDSTTGALRATLVSFADGTWIVSDPQGRFDTSDRPPRGVHFVAGMDAIELEQLRERFQRPRLLSAILTNERLADVPLRLIQVASFPEVQRVDLPVSGTRMGVRLLDRGGGVGRLIVKVNGRELAPAAIRSRRVDGKVTAVNVDLRTSVLREDGVNDVSVSAYDRGNIVASLPKRLSWQTVAATLRREPELFVLAVGASRFSGPEGMNLQFAASDATAFASALGIGAARLFGDARTHFIVLTSDAAGEEGLPTKANIRRAWSDIAARARPEDTVVAYLAGHGVTDGSDRYYFLTQEARSTALPDESVREISTVSSDELRRWLQFEVQALKQVVILDTCGAGAAEGQLGLIVKRAGSPNQIRAIERLKEATGSIVLMGSTASKESYESSRYGTGLLTHALLSAMQGEMALENDQLTVLRWFSFAADRVPDLARGIGEIQRPRISAPSVDDFPIALLSADDRRRIVISQPRPRVLRVLCLDENDLDAAGLERGLRIELREMALPPPPGQDRVTLPFVYLDNVAGDLPGALQPRIRYRRSGAGFELSLRLVRDGVVVAYVPDLAATDLQAAVTALARAIMAAVTRLSP